MEIYIFSIRLLTLVSADVGGAGTHDKDLRASAWESKLITESCNAYSLKVDSL